MAGAEVGTKVIAVMSGIIGACSGLILSYFTAIADIKVVQNDINNIKQQITNQMDDRYRGADARRDHAIIEQRDAEMRNLIQINAEHIAELERMLRTEIERHNSEHRSDS